MAKKIIGYVRVSTETQNYERQVEIIKDYCVGNGYELVDIISEKISGASDNRIGYDSLFTLTKDDCDIIAITEFSRFTRKENFLEVCGDIPKIVKKDIIIDIVANKTIKSISKEDAKDFSKMVLLLADIYGSMTEKENIAQRMKSGKINKFNSSVTNMMYCGGVVPFGYKVIENTQNDICKSLLVIDEEKAVIVRRIFNMLVGGKSARDITYTLQKENIYNTNEKPFKMESVCYMIHNKLYKGIYKISESNELQFQGIVSPELWEQAQIALSNNNISKEKNVVYYNPLKGLIKCAVCGKSMSIKSTRDFIHYFCASHKTMHNDKVCPNGAVSVLNVFKCVWHAVDASCNKKEFKKNTDRTIKEIEREIKNKQAEIATNTKAIPKLKKEMNMLAEKFGYTENESLYSSLQSLYIEKEKEIKRNEEETAKLKNDVSKLNNRIERLKNEGVKKLFSNPTEEEIKDVFAKCIENVYIFKSKIYQGFCTCKVVFRNSVYIDYLIVAPNKTEIFQLPSTYEVRENTIIMPKGESLKDAEGNFNFGTDATEEISLKDYYKSITNDEDNILNGLKVPDALKYCRKIVAE